MAVERTLCILKPDVAEKPASRAILIKLIAAALCPVRLQLMQLTRTEVIKLYDAHSGRSYFARNVDFMTSGPCFVMVLEGEDAITRLRELVGPTDPDIARRTALGELKPWSLRALYGVELPRNAIHASATVEEAKREIAIFFPNDQQ